MFKKICGIGLVGVLTIAPMVNAFGAEVNPNEDSESLSQFVNADFIGDVESAYSSSPSSTNADSGSFNVDSLNGLNVPSISQPLIDDGSGEGLLNLGSAGALNNYAHSSSYNKSKAASGAVGEDGAINLDGINNGDYGNIKVNLTNSLNQLGLSGVSDQIVDELSLEMGAIASTANSNGSSESSDYVVSDGTLTMSSPAVADLSYYLNDIVDNSFNNVEESYSTELEEMVSNVDLSQNIGLSTVNVSNEDVQYSIEVRDALNGVVENIINDELKDSRSIVSIDLQSGEIKVDLSKVVKGNSGEDLNGLDPNTEIFTNDNIEKITTALTDALGNLNGRFSEAFNPSIEDVHVVYELKSSIEGVDNTVEGTTTVDLTLGQLAGADDSDPVITTDMSALGVSNGDIVDAISENLLDSIFSNSHSVAGGLIGMIFAEADMSVYDIVNPILMDFEPVFNNLNKVVKVIVNEQPTRKDNAEESNVKGDNGDGFTVNALSLELLPAAESIDINLASSSVRAIDESPEDPSDEDANTNAAASASASANANDNDESNDESDPSTNVNGDDDTNPASAASSNSSTNPSADANPNANADADEPEAPEAPVVEDQTIEEGGQITGYAFPGGSVTVEWSPSVTVEWSPYSIAEGSEIVIANADGNFTIEGPEDAGLYNYSAFVEVDGRTSDNTDFIVRVEADESEADDGGAQDADSNANVASAANSNANANDNANGEDPIDNREINVNPDRISSSDFTDKNKGVEILVKGFSEGEKITLNAESDNKNVSSIQLDDIANEDGEAVFKIYGMSPDGKLYIGEYNVVAYGVNDNEDMDSLKGSFVVFDENVDNTPMISTELPNGKIGDDYEGTITTDKGEITEVNNLPDGLEYEDGKVVGVPTKDGEFDVVIIADNDGETSTITETITIFPADEDVIQKPVISTDLPNGKTDEEYKGTITTDVGEIVSVENLPNGLKYEDGKVSGTPEHHGINKVVITADNEGQTSTETVLLTIDPADESPIGEDPKKDNSDNSKDDNSKKKVSTGELSKDNGNGFIYYLFGGIGLIGLLSVIGYRFFKVKK